MSRGGIYNHSEISLMVGMNVQKGMNFRPAQRHYSILLMSRRKGAPYNDFVSDDGRTIIYEGHDVPKSDAADPKEIDQSLVTKFGGHSENGKFFEAAKSKKHTLVRVFEKLKPNIWVDNGYFNLIDAWQEEENNRKVYKFKLQIVEGEDVENVGSFDIQNTRAIPSIVKQEVWKRDNGVCVQCGSNDNLHFDHVLPFSKGGTSLLVENIQLLCARHNLEKSNKL